MNTLQEPNNKKIFFLRHGNSLSNSVDINRELSEIGKDSVLKTCDLLKDFKINYILHSPAIRTLQTAHIVKSELGIDNIMSVKKLYNAKSQDIFNSISTIAEHYKNILIVGHNPSISILSKEQIQTGTFYYIEYDGKWSDIWLKDYAN